MTFDGYTVDGPARRISGPDGDVHVEPQVFDVMMLLIAERHRVVRKEELIDTIWGSRFVSESALTSRVKQLRAALGDNGRDQHTVRTVHGAGYQFIKAVHVARAEGDPDLVAGAGREAAAPALRRLPVVVDSFRGREVELRELHELLADERLVTLLGPGGTGKTRLSLEYAAAHPDEPIVFVDLASVRDAAAIGPAVAAALGVETGVFADEIEACSAYLRTQPFLLIVDNCEHEIEAAAGLVRRLLDEAPQLSILATSRVPLALADEQLVRLDPLPLPDGDAPTPEQAATAPAIALFLDRARRVDRHFTLDTDTVGPVVTLCTALDGLPLALELAAARMASLSLGDLVARLDRRLDLLASTQHTAAERHRTLRATLDWSYELLGEDHQRLFRFVSVFPAGMTADGMEWLGARIDVGDELLGVLDGLVSASLLNVIDRPSGRRYQQLETMRTFGLDQLSARDELDDAHDLSVAWTEDLLERQQRELRSPREVHWDDRIRRELPNIRTARTHLHAEAGHEQLLAISMALDEWARIRDVSELWTWTDQLAELEWADERNRCAVAALAGQAAWRRGRISEAEELTRAFVDDPGCEHGVRMRGLGSLGASFLFQGRYVDAAAAWQRRAQEDGTSLDLGMAAVALAYAGEGGRALAIAEESVRLATQAEWPSAIAWSSYVMGEVLTVAGSADGVRWLEDALDRATETGGAFILGVAGVTLCSATAARGDTVEAAHRFAELIGHWLRTGTWTQTWTTLRNAAALLVERDPALALSVIATSERDPYAAILDGEARAAQDLERAALVERVGEDTAELIEREAAHVDRSELAARVQATLAAF